MFWSFVFPTKSQSQTHYFQKFLVTKYLRTAYSKKIFHIEATSMFLFLRWDVSKSIKNTFIKIEKHNAN